MQTPKSRVYVQTDSESRVLRLDGEYSLPDDLAGWTKIDEGYGDRFSLAQSHYLDKPLYDGAVLRYKLVDGKVVERTAEEIEADKAKLPKPVIPPTNEELASSLASVQSASAVAFVALCEVGTLDTVTASEHAELFAEWAYPVAYTVGQLRRHNGKLYRCVQAHTSQADWTPDTAASLWSVAADPAEEWPAWSQPVGAHDAYTKGDKVSHNGKHWTSNVDSNVWEPSVFGWAEYTE